jgi:addiction module RelB/DinJ family antitoxin
MPADAVVRARIDLRLKRQAEAILAARGLTISEALRQLMMHVARNNALPFELIVQPSKAIKEKGRNMNNVVTPEMRHHSGARTLNYFGFRGNRAAISLLYARSEGASQLEVNNAGRALGSPQENYLNMLHQAIKWGHKVFVWDDPTRGGKVYKLSYNPSHSGPGEVDPPDNWKAMNALKTPPGVTPTMHRARRS